MDPCPSLNPPLPAHYRKDERMVRGASCLDLPVNGGERLAKQTALPAATLTRRRAINGASFILALIVLTNRKTVYPKILSELDEAEIMVW